MFLAQPWSSHDGVGSSRAHQGVLSHASLVHRKQNPFPIESKFHSSPPSTLPLSYPFEVSHSWRIRCVTPECLYTLISQLQHVSNQRLPSLQLSKHSSIFRHEGCVHQPGIQEESAVRPRLWPDIFLCKDSSVRPHQLAHDFHPDAARIV